MHVVRKEDSSTSKLHIVFDASAKTNPGISLNNKFLIRPMLHRHLIDVLVQFQSHKVALTADMSQMYRAILLPDQQWDLHWFVWRNNPLLPLKNYETTRLTFGICALSFAANMVMKQNAIDRMASYRWATWIALNLVYLDDGLMGADSIQEAKKLRKELQELFNQGGFHLRKWKVSECRVWYYSERHVR